MKVHPRGRLEVRGRTADVEGREASPDVHERLWPRFVRMFRQYEDYQRATARRIPIIELTVV